jgi:hypothetical protein
VKWKRLEEVAVDCFIELHLPVNIDKMPVRMSVFSIFEVFSS